MREYGLDLRNEVEGPPRRLWALIRNLSPESALARVEQTEANKAPVMSIADFARKHQGGGYG